MPTAYFEIAECFRGPPNSGNSCYVCGRIAHYLRGTIAVRLRAPPPLATPLRLEYTPERAHLFHDTTLVAEAGRAALAVQPPSPPSFEQAERATSAYLGFRTHAFPGCFVCGPERKPGEGLRLFPGKIN